jgi:transposase
VKSRPPDHRLGGVIRVQEWAEIRHLHFAEGMSARAIAVKLGVARDTVARALRAESPPRYARQPSGSAFDAVEARVRRLLTEFPSMPATVLAERVGWTGSASWFRKRVAVLRPQYAPKDPADRLTYRPGDQAQCDLWFPPVKVPVGGGQVASPPVLVMVASFSRFLTAWMLPSRTTPDLLAGIWQVVARQLTAVPRRLVWDNEAGSVAAVRVLPHMSFSVRPDV